MKAVRNSFVLFAASVVMSGAAQAQVESALFHEGMPTNSIASITLEMKTEPQLVLGSSMQFTGLFVDCVTPQQTWAMLNPSVPARNPQKPLPPSVLPVKAPSDVNSNLAVHEPDFALLRLSFP